MSKAVKKVVSVVAAIAVPFVAPAIASAIGLSAAIGSTAGSALVGAGLGAANAAITGGNIGRGALMGGLSGGLAGYMSAPASVASSAQAPTYRLGASPTYSLASPTTTSLASPTAGLYESAVFGPVDYSLTPGLSPEAASLVSPTSGLYESALFGPTDYSLTAGNNPISPVFRNYQPSFASAASGATAGTAGGESTSFLGALSKVPGEIASRFSDPKALADLTLRAAGQLVGSAAAGDGLSPEERRLLNAQTEELRKLQQSNVALFKERLEQARNLIGESKYFDPEYFGLQSARQAQLAGARAKQAGLRGLENAARQAEGRRYDLGISRNVGTAFDTGYNTGVQGRLSTITAGINAMPNSYPDSTSGYSNLRNAYANAAAAARQRQKDIGTLFGSLTGYYGSERDKTERGY